jgi:hypothetical protein
MSANKKIAKCIRLEPKINASLRKESTAKKTTQTEIIHAALRQYLKPAS